MMEEIDLSLIAPFKKTKILYFKPIPSMAGGTNTQICKWDFWPPQICQKMVNKFVQTMMQLFNASFFSIFLWMLSVFIELYYLIPIDFTWFCYRLCNFYNMVTDMWMDKQIDNIMDRQTDWWADRSINGWTCNTHAKNDEVPIDFAIFTKALPTDRWTDGPTNGRTYPLIEMRGRI